MSINAQNYDTFYCRMSELAEGDTSQLLSTYRIAQEAYIVDQRLATLALGILDGSRVLELARGDGELPRDNERLQLGVFTVVSAEVAKLYDLDVARLFMKLPDFYSGEAPVELIGSIDQANRRDTVMSLYDSTVDF